MRLSIEHVTHYRYARPVQLGPHRIMVRPMESHLVQIRSSAISIQPAHRIRWIHDVFDNSIALVDFTEPASQMQILSRVEVEQFNTNPFDFILDSVACEMPFTYPEPEVHDVLPFTQPSFPQDRESVLAWIKPFLDLQGHAKTLDFLTSLNKSFPFYFQYHQREEPGVQSPGQTLKQRAGSCRDFAFLLMEAARHKGLAARFVSGYLCSDNDDPKVPDAAANATHAWAEVYLPGAGWKGFDPTCGILAADLHVRVAVSRHPNQAPPVSGTFIGKNEDYLGMSVTVNAQQSPGQSQTDS